MVFLNLFGAPEEEACFTCLNHCEVVVAVTAGDVIDGTISGFHWYDSNEQETIDPGITVTVGDLKDGAYTITISNK